MSRTTVDNPFFARVWTVMARHESESLMRLRRARLQKIADATLWLRIAGNCHTHRHTEQTIVGAGFKVSGARRELTLPAWVPMPVAEFAIGRAVKPA